MKKVLVILIVSFLAIFFINFVFTGHAFALNFGTAISEQASMLLLGIVLIVVAGFGRKKFFKK
jgi:membrane protease YdiL (CAAX protease family)